jgi:hypothetical protein
MDYLCSSVLSISHDTEWNSFGTNTWQGPVEYRIPSVPGEGSDIVPFCALGVAQLDSSGVSYDSLEPQLFVEQNTTADDSCPGHE